MGLSRRGFLKVGAGIAGSCVAGMSFPALSAPRNVRFSLDIRVYGGNCPFLLGNSAGIYKDLNMNVTIDGSSGSAEAIRRLALGMHDFAFADISTLVEFTAQNPESAPKLILPVMDHSPASIMTIGKNKIPDLASLEGRKIGVAANSAATKLLPALLELNRIEQSKLNFINIDTKLRDTLLLKGEIDGVVGYDYTSVFNFVGQGVKMEDINILYFSEFGFDFPANSLVASQKMVKEEPELCKAMALATARAWRASYKDPKAAIAAAVAKEPLLVPDVELQRFLFILKHHVDTARVREHGLGYLDPKRMADGLALLAQGFQMPTPVTLSDIYVPDFLPDQSERMIFG